MHSLYLCSPATVCHSIGWERGISHAAISHWPHVGATARFSTSTWKYHTIAPDSIARTYLWSLCSCVYPDLSASDANLFSLSGCWRHTGVYRKGRWKLLPYSFHDLRVTCAQLDCFWLFHPESHHQSMPSLGNPANSLCSNGVERGLPWHFHLMPVGASWCEWP